MEFPTRASGNPYKTTHVGGATFTIGAEISNAITVNVQLNSQYDLPLTAKGWVGWYLSSDSGGNALASAITGVAAGTDGIVVEETTGVKGYAVSEDDGDIDMVFTKSSGAATVYLNLRMPDGSIVTSGALTFAA